MSKILIVLEGPSKYDELKNEPLYDQDGQQFIKFLHKAGIIYNDCEVTHVCQHFIQEPRNKTKKKLRYFAKYTPKYQILKPEVEQYLGKLKEVIDRVQPTVILACGELSLFVLTGEISLTKQRGSILPTTPEFFGTKVIPTYTPHEMQVMYEWHFQFLCDAKRALYESTFEELRAPKWEFYTRPTASAVVSRLETLLKWATKRPDTSSHGRLHKIDGSGWLEYSTVKTDENESDEPYLNITPEGKWLMSADIETRKGYITCIGIAWTEYSAMCIPFLAVDGDPFYFIEEEEQAIVLLLKKLFTHPNIEWAYQNENYDFQYEIAQWGFKPRHSCDTMQMHHTCWSGLKKSLDFQASLKLRYYRYWKDEGKEFHESIKTPQEEELYWEYNCKDCVVTYELALYNYIELVHYNQMEPYKFQMQQQVVALRMMLRGTKANLSLRGKLAIQVMDAIKERQDRLNYLVGEELNIKSPKQMTEFFYGSLGQKRINNKKSGNPTADADALELIGLREPIIAPICEIIGELRSLGVFLGTFIKAAPSPDGRYRTSYKVAGPETFRWASAKDVFGQGLNLQNIPKGTED